MEQEVGKNRFLELVERCRGRKILVVGDIMLDKYIIGGVSRISAEAPVQIVKVNEEKFALGGAANVANNILAFGGVPIMVGVVGNDRSKEIVLSEFIRKRVDVSGIFVDEAKPTVEKVRILAMGQQLLRVDYEEPEKITESMERRVIEFVKSKIDEVDAVVVSDYDKGVVSENVMKELNWLTQFKNKRLVVDPRPQNMELYGRVDVITPNFKEAVRMAGLEDRRRGIEEVGNKLLSRINSEILVTRGEEGMTLFEKTGETTHIPTKAKEVYDVTGAGDTVVAILGLVLASGASMKEAAIISNYAAGVTVGKVGTSTVSIEEIKRSIDGV